MITTMAKVKVRTGEEMEILAVDGPDEKWGASIVKLCYLIDAVQCGPIWQWQLDQIFGGKAGGGSLKNRFYIAIYKGTIAGCMSLISNGFAGILGYVITSPEHRRKGIGALLVKTLLADARERNISVITLGTAYGGPAYKMFLSFGFRSIVLKSCFMIRTATKKTLTDVYRKGPVECMDAAWGHYPMVSTLFHEKRCGVVRSQAHRVFGIGSYEEGYVWDMKGALENAAGAKVLQLSDTGVVIGYACLRRDLQWAALTTVPDTWMLDILVHQDFTDQGSVMLSGFKWPKGKTLCYVEPDAQWKRNALRKLGFRKEGLLEKQLGGKDVEILGLHA